LKLQDQIVASKWQVYDTVFGQVRSLHFVGDQDKYVYMDPQDKILCIKWVPVFSIYKMEPIEIEWFGKYSHFALDGGPEHNGRGWEVWLYNKNGERLVVNGEVILQPDRVFKAAFGVLTNNNPSVRKLWSYIDENKEQIESIDWYMLAFPIWNVNSVFGPVTKFSVFDSDEKQLEVYINEKKEIVKINWVRAAQMNEAIFWTPWWTLGQITTLWEGYNFGWYNSDAEVFTLNEREVKNFKREELNIGAINIIWFEDKTIEIYSDDKILLQYDGWNLTNIQMNGGWYMVEWDMWYKNWLTTEQLKEVLSPANPIISDTSSATKQVVSMVK